MNVETQEKKKKVFAPNGSMKVKLHTFIENLPKKNAGRIMTCIRKDNAAGWLDQATMNDFYERYSMRTLLLVRYCNKILVSILTNALAEHNYPPIRHR